MPINKKDDEDGYIHIIIDNVIKNYLTDFTLFTLRGQNGVEIPIVNEIIDRLVHHYKLVKITGMSYRIKDKSIFEEEAKKRQFEIGEKQHFEIDFYIYQVY